MNTRKLLKSKPFDPSMKNIHLTYDLHGNRYLFTESRNPADGRRKVWLVEGDSGLLKKIALFVDPSRKANLNLYDVSSRATGMIEDAYDGTNIEVVVRRQRKGHCI